MEKKINLSKEEIRFYIDLITTRFLTNPRMNLLFGENSKKGFYKKVENLVTYCFCLALKLNGVYIAKNKKTVVLFYEKKKFSQGTLDYKRYLKVIIGIGMSRVIQVLKNENEIKKHKLSLKNYLYVWFIAQEEGYGKLDGLKEVNTMLFDYAKQRDLAILLETSNNQLLNLYKRAGFSVYDTITKNKETIYFLADANTVRFYQPNST